MRILKMEKEMVKLSFAIALKRKKKKEYFMHLKLTANLAEENSAR